MKTRLLWVLALGFPLLLLGGSLLLDARTGGGTGGPTLSVDDDLRSAALALDVTPKALARELGLPLDVAKNRSLKDLGVQADRWKSVESHLRSHGGSDTGYAILVGLSFFGLLWLLALGRGPKESRKRSPGSYPSWIPVTAAVVAVAVAGFATGKSPNPMEAAVKPFKALVGLYPDPGVKWALLAVFLVLALVGEKLVCGWACPFGAWQELLHRLPGLKKLKRRLVLPGRLTLLARTLLFAAFLVVLFGVVGGRKGFVLYHGLNPFNLFGLDLDELLPWLVIGIVSLLSLVLYRPFCQLVCPFGFLSNLLSFLHLSGVKVDPKRCTSCGACTKACPTDAMKDRFAGRVLPADCTSCARCLPVCPENAIAYLPRWKGFDAPRS